MGDQGVRAKYYYDPCVPAQTGPQSMIVRQVIGEREKQKVIDLHVCVPMHKPAIEQIVDVFVKDVEVDCIDVITDRVIVRGEFEVKAIYVACLPEQPVHAIEIKHYKWTQDIDIPGARRGMDADAGVMVEFVDYDVDECCRAYKHKYYGSSCDSDDCSCSSDLFASSSDCSPCEAVPMPPISPCPPKPSKPPKPPKLPKSCDSHHHHHHHHHCSSSCSCCSTECLREFDVSIILRITAKVLASREVQLNPPMMQQPVVQPPVVQTPQNQTSAAIPSAPLPENPKG